MGHRDVLGAGRLLAAICVVLLLVVGCQKGSETPPPAQDSAAAPNGEAGGTAPQADAVELEFWKSVKDSESTDDLWTYLERYPQGAFADLAKSRIERLAQGDTSAEKTPAPAATPPAAAAPRLSRKQIVQNVIQRKVGRYREPRVHIAPDIPRRKLDNAAGVHGFDTSQVLMLYDDGFSGGGKTGMVLTDRKVYWRFVKGSPAYYLDYEDIETVRVRKKKFLLNGYDVSTTMSSDPETSAELFADLLEEIRDELRRR